MSEKRSWDIQPKQKAAAPVARPISAPQRQTAPASPAPRPRPVLKAAPKKQPTPPAQKAAQRPRREKVPQGREREPLKERRRRERRRTSIILSIFFVLIVAGAFICLWLPAFRVEHVDAAGPDANAIQVVALNAMTGSDYYVFPRDSIFYFPEAAIRSQILSQYPDISAVAISRTSLDAISLASVPRTQSFIWCGTTYSTGEPTVQTDASSTDPTVVTAPSCYSVDGQGVLFAAVPMSEASSTDSLIAYGPLSASSTSATGSVVLGSTLANNSIVPNTLELIKIMKSLNAAIVTFALRDDEVDLYTQGGTRITYVQGRETMAEQLAESAFSSLNLNDGSLEYVDLRFDGKVYFKKVGSDSQTSASASTSQ